MTRPARILALLAWAASMVACPSPASAQSVDELIERGVSLRERGEDREALDVFERAYEMSRSARALAQIAMAEQALGRFLDAEEHMSAALAADDAWIRRRRRVLRDALEEVRRHVGRILVVGVVDGAQVRLDGRLAGTLPMSEPVRVDAGTVHLMVSADGYRPVERELEVPGGELTRTEVSLTPTDETGPETADGGEVAVVAGASPGAGGVGWPVWVGFGVAAVAATTAVVLWQIGESDAEEWNSGRCIEGGIRDENCPGLDSDITALRTWAGLWTAVAAASVGVAVFFLLGSEDGEERASVRCGAGLGSVGCRGRF